MNEEKAGSFFYGWWIVLAATTVLSAQGVMFYGFGILFPSILEEFNWSRALTSSILSVQISTSSMISILLGYLIDRYSPRLIISLGVLFFSVGLIFSSMTREIWHLYLFLGLIVGLGNSTTYLPPITVVTRWFEKRRGLAIGISVAGIGFGGFLGSPFLNWLIQSFGWRIALIILGILSGIVVFVAASLFVGHPKNIGLRPYGAGASASGGNRRPPAGDRRSPVGDRESPPLLKDHPPTSEKSLDLDWPVLEALKTRSFFILFLMLFLAEVSLIGIMTHLFTYAAENGVPKPIVSWAYGVIGIASLIGKVGVGALSDRIGRKTAFLLSFVLKGTAFIIILPAPNIFRLYLFAAILGLAYGGWTPLFPAIVGDYFGLGSMGKIFSILTINFFVGGACGPILAGRVFDRTGSYFAAFIIFSGICYFAAFLSLFLRYPDKATLKGRF